MGQIESGLKGGRGGAQKTRVVVRVTRVHASTTRHEALCLRPYLTVEVFAKLVLVTTSAVLLAILSEIVAGHVLVFQCS